MKTDSQLANEARGVAKTMTYNEGKPEAAAKHLLLELAHRMDSSCRYVVNTGFRFTVGNSLGKERPMTLREIVMYAVFKVIPERV